jgi:hypothetical protein
LYTVADETLFVYSMSDHTSPIATYQLGGNCYSGIIAENHLYLGSYKKLQLYRVNNSITQPLIRDKVIITKNSVLKILRVGHELMLGEAYG